GTNLHGGSVRAQKKRRARGLFVRRGGQVDVERVHVVADRMKLRDIQRLEIVVRRFNFRPLHNGKTNGEEDVLEFLKNLADEVMRADGMDDARERKVYALLLEGGFFGAGFDGSAALFKSFLQIRLEFIQFLPDDALQFGLSRLQPVFSDSR